MPIYEYRCQRCDQTFELIQKFSDQPLSVHEGCGGSVERLLSSPALQFKGTGWYVTDYARKGSNGKPEGKKESKAPDTKTESKSESKSASKPDTSTTKSESK